MKKRVRRDRASTVITVAVVIPVVAGIVGLVVARMAISILGWSDDNPARGPMLLVGLIIAIVVGWISFAVWDRETRQWIHRYWDLRAWRDAQDERLEQERALLLTRVARLWTALEESGVDPKPIASLPPNDATRRERVAEEREWLAEESDERLERAAEADFRAHRAERGDL